MVAAAVHSVASQSVSHFTTVKRSSVMRLGAIGHNRLRRQQCAEVRNVCFVRDDAGDHAPSLISALGRLDPRGLD
ncbi:unnamed protein product [Heligmosomoides polygyrus]|uniref:Secreted protein n=1 Tax=Heligmosomoides polygyrus TaxID=6339 RepID=A0A183GX89_HELPZ|nr:unnamed protein product [Heligmosomoides polygyrus]